MSRNNSIITAIALPGLLLFAACSGRTADNMTPAGETVEVVIPDGDIARDSIIANGGYEVQSGDIESTQGDIESTQNEAFSPQGEASSAQDGFSN